MGFDSIFDLWEEICQESKKYISETGFNAWLKDLKPISMDSDCIVLSINSAYKKKIIEQNYKEVLENSCLEVSGLNFKIEIVIENAEESADAVPAVTPVIKNYTFDNFIVGSSNKFAHAASLAVAENPANVYNPLFIYGNSGVGKTHLMLAIKEKIEEKFPDKKIEFSRCEQFTNALIEAIRCGTVDAFHKRFREIDVLLMDDIQFIAGKTSTEEEFFNTFNALYQDHKQIVVTSDRPPKEIKALDERMRSRFESGLLADVSPPDFETRVGILKSKSEQLDFNISDDILFYIAEQVKINTRQLEGIIKKLQAYSNVNSIPLNLGMVQKCVKDIVSEATPDPITVEKVVDEVSRTYNVSAEEIFSRKKKADIAYARQVSMYIVSKVTNLSITTIGKKFEKDHSTVLYNVQKVENLIKENSFEKRLINDIIKNLEG